MLEIRLKEVNPTGPTYRIVAELGESGPGAAQPPEGKPWTIDWQVTVYPCDPNRPHFSHAIQATWARGAQTELALDATLEPRPDIRYGDVVVLKAEIAGAKEAPQVAPIALVAGYKHPVPIEQAILLSYIKRNIDGKLEAIATAMGGGPALPAELQDAVSNVLRNLNAAFDPAEAASIHRTFAPVLEAARIAVAARQPAPTEYERVWRRIRAASEALSFARYEAFVADELRDPRPRGDYQAFIAQLVAGNADMNFPRNAGGFAGHPQGAHALDILRYATELYVLREGGFDAGTIPEDPAPAPVPRLLQSGDNDLRPNLRPARRAYCVELLASYWDEEAPVAMTWKAICLRFQNRRHPRLRDPLANLDVHPLRPLSALIWSYVGSERDWLTPQRRNLEYQYAYGIGLSGSAVSAADAVVRRNSFLPAFHALLRVCAQYYRDASNTMVIPEVRPLLDALREVRRYLVDGMHNQYGQLPWQAKVEMLMMKYLLSQAEVGQFLPTPPLTTNPDWIGRIDAMRRLQGWGDTSARHFESLSRDGELLLLSIRFGPWATGVPNDSEANARYWVSAFREEIQEYIHAYRAVTGVDLSSAAELDTQMPSVHLQRRRALQAGAVA